MVYTDHDLHGSTLILIWVYTDDQVYVDHDL